MRKLATAAAVSLALASGGAFGLGLGDIEMRSALNQPMNAEIRLTSVQPGEIDGMIVQLASPDAFARAGIERSPVLSDLSFSVDQSSGVPLIRISSQRPVVEPFLNFLLEVDWPQGRMVREYTVLLDPPVFMTPSASDLDPGADQSTVVQRGDEALVVPTPIERDIVAAADEEFEVELINLDEELGDQATGNLDDGGEIVSLDSIPDATLLTDSAPTLITDGDVVSLTDLGAPNTDAIAQRELVAEQTFDLDSIEVELLGAGEEIADDIVVGAAASQAQELEATGSDESNIVSLDDLLPESAEQETTVAAPSGEVTVQSGDTLFDIARANTVSGASVQQMMMALLAANESAFINQNINLVRAGAILRVPEAEETTRLTQAQALAAIGDQNQLWQDYRDSLRGTSVTQIAQNTVPDNATTPVNVDEVVEAADDNASIETATLDVDGVTDELSAEAQAILDNARNEILNGDELRILADNAPTTTAASATADETENNEAQRLGEVNRKLQLAREELSSTRLQADDLTDQANELQNTGENLDSLVSLRQNEVAKLEAQLADARAADEAAEIAAAAAASDAEDVANEALADAADTGGELIADASTAVGNVAGTASTESSTAISSLTDAGEEAVDTGSNALTDAGEVLEQVELVGSDDEIAQAEAEAVIAPPVKQTSWYQDVLDDPKRLAIAGIGGIGLLGVLGTLLFRRRNREDESMLEVGDDTKFIDDSETEQLQTEIDDHYMDASDESGKFGGVAAAGAAAVGGVVANSADAFGNTADDDQLSDALSEMGDDSLSFGSETQAVADATSAEGNDKDDTISEVDVYLAYGLHGQAEELLTKAIERKPNQPEYAQKLLQTYHAQGNAEGFHQAAQNFHARFGGELNPEWTNVAAMGLELRPNDPLYAAAQDSVNVIGVGHSNGNQLGDEDFQASGKDDSMGSVSRDFGSNDESTDDMNESDLMDQSIDPAFAFDEGDLEATGDFSQITNELAAENNGSIDFPDLDSTLATVGAAASIDDPLADAGDLLGDTLSVDDLTGVTDSSDDMTLDLDQLSGDLELDPSELLSADLSELEIPDLTAENDLLMDDSASIANSGDSADEMDTMLDLAKAYIDMGDKDSASSALGEIVKSGNPEQITEAETLLLKIS